MGVDISSGGGGGIVIESDPTALKKASNLSDLTNVESAKATLGISTIKIADYNNAKTYAAGDQVVFSNKLYRFNAFIGAAGYAPDTHPFAWTSLSAEDKESEIFRDLDPSYFNIPLQGSGWGSSSSAGGGSVADGPFSIQINGPYTGAGFAQRTLDTQYLQTIYRSNDGFAWNKRIIFSFRLYPINSTMSPDIRLKVHFGTAGGTGIGIQKFGHQNFAFLNHDGTTERVILTDFNFGFETPVDFLIDSNGQGTSKLYINGVLKATSTQAPVTFSGKRIQIASYSTAAVNVTSAMTYGLANLKFKSFDY